MKDVGFTIFLLVIFALYYPEGVGKAAGQMVRSFNAELSTPTNTEAKQ